MIAKKDAENQRNEEGEHDKEQEVTRHLRPSATS